MYGTYSESHLIIFILKKFWVIKFWTGCITSLFFSFFFEKKISFFIFKTDNKRNIQLQIIQNDDTSDSINNEQIHENKSYRTYSNRNMKNVTIKNSNSFNKKLSRISGRRDIEEGEDEIEQDEVFKNYQNQKQNAYNQNMTPTNNRKLKLVRMSNDPDTTTTESENPELDQRHLNINHKIPKSNSKQNMKKITSESESPQEQEALLNSKNINKQSSKIIRRNNVQHSNQEQQKPRPTIIYSEDGKSDENENESDKTLSASYLSSPTHQIFKSNEDLIKKFKTSAKKCSKFESESKVSINGKLKCNHKCKRKFKEKRS